MTMVSALRSSAISSSERVRAASSASALGTPLTPATFAVGKSLEYYHHANLPFTADQRNAAYQEAFEHGKLVAGSLVKETS